MTKSVVRESCACVVVAKRATVAQPETVVVAKSATTICAHPVCWTTIAHKVRSVCWDVAKQVIANPRQTANRARSAKRTSVLFAPKIANALQDNFVSAVHVKQAIAEHARIATRGASRLGWCVKRILAPCVLKHPIVTKVKSVIAGSAKRATV